MKKRTLLSYALAFFLALFIAIIISFVGVSIGLGDKALFQSTISESGYYKTLGESLETKTIRILEDYRLPVSFGTDLWSEVEVYRDMNQYSKNVLYNGQSQDEVPEFVIRISDEIKARMNQYYNERKPSSQEEWKRVVDEVTSIIITDYHHSIRLPLLEEYPKFNEKLNQYRAIVFVACGLLCFLICVLLFNMYKHKNKSLRYICYAVFCGSFMNPIMNNILRRQMVIGQDYLADEAYTSMCNEVVNAGFEHAYLGVYIGLFIGFILTAVTIWLKEKNM
ncbi:MAG: hypothetical protein LBR68_04490 [Lachnoclostridium sp.]|jgi:hypothetical protein|nr:hypothetical protein [Lachnoclostridium sp.]